MSIPLAIGLRVGLDETRTAPATFHRKAASFLDYAPRDRLFLGVALALTCLIIGQPPELIGIAAGGWMGISVALAVTALLTARKERMRQQLFWSRRGWWNDFKRGQRRREYVYVSPQGSGES